MPGLEVLTTNAAFGVPMMGEWDADVIESRLRDAVSGKPTVTYMNADTWVLDEAAQTLFERVEGVESVYVVRTYMAARTSRRRRSTLGRRGAVWARRSGARAVMAWRTAGARPSRAHRAGRAVLARVAAHALYVCRLYGFYVIPALCTPVACGGRADRRAASAARPPRGFFASGCCMRARVYKFRSRAADSHSHL